MESTVTVVVGSCVPERGGIAHRLARATGSEIIHAERLAVAKDPVREATSLIPWITPQDVVVEYPMQAPIRSVIGSLVDPEEPTQLAEVVCVLDAVHFFSELERTDQVEYLEFHHGTPFTASSARALLTVEQIEYCSTALLVNAEQLPEQDVEIIRAIIAELAPWAQVVLDDGTWQPSRTRENPIPKAQDPAGYYDAVQIRPGWIAYLNGLHTAQYRHPRVASMRYTNPRPFHPMRLQRALDEHLEPGSAGKIVRSCGFCRLASRPGITAGWSHTGSVMAIDPLARDEATPGEPLSFGQDIVFTGFDLRPTELTQALDDAVLSDSELMTDPDEWHLLPDPFPAWVTVRERFE